MHVIVTGGSSGIGLAVARAYALQGAAVSLVARDQGRLEAARKDLGANVFSVSADTTANAALSSAIAACEAANGPCDVLVASAGIVDPAAFETLPPDLFDRQISINLLGTVNAVRAVYSGMKGRGRGTIMIVSSGAALIGIHGYAAYCASKSALDGFVEALQMEALGSGVRVSICYPPDTLTPQYQQELPARPWQAELLMGKVKPWAADAVALRIVTAIGRRQARVYFTPSLAALALFGPVIKPALRLWYRWRLRQKERMRPIAFETRHEPRPAPRADTNST